MTTLYNFGRRSLKQGQVPLATSRLVQTMAGEKQEALCRHRH